MILDVGRACVIKKGRDFGKVCMVVERPKGNFVTIEGPKIKRRKINILHVWPLDFTVKNVDELIEEVKKRVK